MVIIFFFDTPVLNNNSKSFQQNKILIVNGRVFLYKAVTAIATNFLQNTKLKLQNTKVL